MKTITKIVLLAVSIFVAVSAVMIYAKTQVEPPFASAVNDQYEPDLDKCLALLHKDVVKGDVGRYQDSIFWMTRERIRFFVQEGKITNQSGDKSLELLLDDYVQMFVNRCYDKFRASVWYADDHRYMLSVISELKDVRNSWGTPVLKPGAKNSLADIEEIISNYKGALAILSRTGYVSVAQSRTVISTAESFAKDKWLSNCLDLRADLLGLKRKIGDSHYHYAERQVEKLSDYRGHGEDYYMNTLIPDVEEEVDEYDKIANNLYGYKKNVNDLWNQMRDYRDAAKYYYKWLNDNTKYYKYD